MRLRYVRLTEILLLAWILFTKNWSILPYWVAMSLSLEILNRQKSYLAQPKHPQFNLWFLGYLVLVVADRSRRFQLSEPVEWSFNSFMHILFGVLVCFKISQYLTVFEWKIPHRLPFIALAFNVLGVLNEFLQNLMGSRAFLVFTPDSWKDLAMNAVGTLVFLVGAYALAQRYRRNPRRPTHPPC